jgi:pimeloyl-ACP methyl ester carboxylesterase
MTDTGMDRADVEFDSHGTRCAAWLYRPAQAADRPTPVVVLGHGLGAVRAMRLDAFAARFAAEGYLALAFDHRHFGDSDGTPRQLLDIARQREDWTAAIAFARTVPGADPDRVIAWGSSFGGGHVLATAARDSRLAAAIAQNPFTDGPASVLALGPVSAAKATGRALRDVLGAMRGAAPLPIPLVGPPGSTALMTAPDAESGYLGLVPDGTDFTNAVAARIALRIPFDRPGRNAAKISCPVLFSVCDNDSIAPARSALRSAARAPRGEVRRYPVGHFDVYTGDEFERVVRDQIAFLHHHVPVG